MKSASVSSAPPRSSSLESGGGGVGRSEGDRRGSGEFCEEIFGRIRRETMEREARPSTRIATQERSRRRPRRDQPPRGEPGELTMEEGRAPSESRVENGNVATVLPAELWAVILRV